MATRGRSFRRQRTALVLACGAAAATGPARAQDVNLDASTVAEFLDLCQANAAKCHDDIADLDIWYMINANPLGYCAPKAADEGAAAGKWLQAHPNVASQKLSNAGLTALRTNYPCSAAAKRPAAPPSTVAEFLGRCAANAQRCDGEILDVMMANEIGWLRSNSKQPLGYCAPDDGNAETQSKPVVDWLQAHPKLSAQPLRSGAEAALKAVYPCVMCSGETNLSWRCRLEKQRGAEALLI
jgi:hypothetical protein